MISYDEIFSALLSEIETHEFLELDEDEVTSIIFKEYLHKTVGNPDFMLVFDTLELDDELMTLDYSLAIEPNINVKDQYVIDLLSTGMLIEWLKPKTYTSKLIDQMIAGKEEKFYSQSNHLSEIKELLNDTKIELERKVKGYNGINNSYLNGKK